MLDVLNYLGSNTTLIQKESFQTKGLSGLEYPTIALTANAKVFL